MATWIYFIHPPRENFAATMTGAEEEVWGRHWQRLKRLFHEGVVIYAGPTFGPNNTGLCIIEADNEAAASRLMDDDPIIGEGFTRGELRECRVSLLRGCDEEWVARDLAQVPAVEQAGRAD